MNLLTLRSQARLKASVAVADFSNANLDIQINEGIYTLASIIAELNEDHFETTPYKFNLALNSAYYNLPSDFMRLKQLRLAYSGTPSANADWKVATGYDVANVQDVSRDEENVSTAHPIVDITGAKLKIKPTPTAAVTNGGYMLYIARPSALSVTGDVPSLIPVQFQDLIAVYAAREMALRYSKEKKWALLNKVWEDGLERLREECADRNMNEPTRWHSPLEGSPRGRNRTELGN